MFYLPKNELFKIWQIRRYNFNTFVINHLFNSKSCHNDRLITVVFDKCFNTVKTIVIGSICNAVPTISKAIQFIFGQQKVSTETTTNLYSSYTENQAINFFPCCLHKRKAFHFDNGLNRPVNIFRNSFLLSTVLQKEASIISLQSIEPVSLAVSFPARINYVFRLHNIRNHWCHNVTWLKIYCILYFSRFLKFAFRQGYITLLKYCFATGDQLHRYCASDIFTVAKPLTTVTYYLMAWLNKPGDTCQAWRHRWPALLTILNKIPFISTKWPYK